MRIRQHFRTFIVFKQTQNVNLFVFYKNAKGSDYLQRLCLAFEKSSAAIETGDKSSDALFVWTAALPASPTSAASSSLCVH